MDEVAPVVANPLPSEGGPAQGTSGSDRSKPRDIPGRVALVLLITGVLSIVAAYSGIGGWLGPELQMLFPVLAIVLLVATPLALIVSIGGLVRAHARDYKAPLSLITLLVSLAGTVLIGTPLIFLATGVWRF
jgi:hypothetical protein